MKAYIEILKSNGTEQRVQITRFPTAYSIHAHERRKHLVGRYVASLKEMFPSSTSYYLIVESKVKEL